MKRYSITVNGNTYDVMVEEVDASYTPPVAAPVAPAAAPAAPVAASAPAPAAPKPAAPKSSAGVNGTQVTAPMPGTILKVKVTPGQSVKKGDVICILEAMKMENDIPSPCDGTIAAINVQSGANVSSGEVLAIIN